MASTYYRGINLSGAELTHDAAHLPGAVNTDYMYHGSADFAYVASRGHKVIRLPFRWERIQPTLNSALNTAELNRLTTAVSQAGSAGLKVILDVHNYARFINSTANGGAELVLGGGLTTANLTDLWTRLSTAFNNNPAVYAYGLMNEPNNLSATSGTFTGTVRYDWSDGTVQGWTGDSATATNVGGKLNLAATATAGTFNFRKDDAGLKRGGTLTGNVLSAVITLGSGVAGSWVSRLQWQNASYQWQTASNITYTRVDTGATVSGLIAGVAVRVYANFASNPITNPNAFAIQIDSGNATAGAVSVAVDDFAQGSLSGALTESQVWEQASQACVTAIRNNGDTTLLLVPGYQYSGAQNWVTNHPTPWITDPSNKVMYEAHYYFDMDNSGTYTQTYAVANAAAVSAGFASLQARALSQIGTFTNWCTSNTVDGFVGEIGWHNAADTASWNAIGNAVYGALDAARIGATYWAAGSWYGTTYNLSSYTGTPLSATASPSSIIEAHVSVLPTANKANSGNLVSITVPSGATVSLSGITPLPTVSGTGTVRTFTVPIITAPQTLVVTVNGTANNLTITPTKRRVRINGAWTPSYKVVGPYTSVPDLTLDLSAAVVTPGTGSAAMSGSGTLAVNPKPVFAATSAFSGGGTLGATGAIPGVANYPSSTTYPSSALYPVAG